MHSLERYRQLEVSQDNFINSLLHIESLSTKYDIPQTDILMAALNLSGIKTDIVPEDRVRFNLKLQNWNKPFFLALCVNTRGTLFELKDSRILFSGGKLAKYLG